MNIYLINWFCEIKTHDRWIQYLRFCNGKLLLSLLQVNKGFLKFSFKNIIFSHLKYNKNYFYLFPKFKTQIHKCVYYYFTETQDLRIGKSWIICTNSKQKFILLCFKERSWPSFCLGICSNFQSPEEALRPWGAKVDCQ